MTRRSRQIEELAWKSTPMGEITLCRRLEPTLGVDVYEVKLGEEYLMSSLFTVAEVALAQLGLAAWRDPARPGAPADPDRPLDVVVGGLGLGYTARTALEDDQVTSVVVVEALGEVIRWHAENLLPDTVGLTADPRTRLVEGDFFALAASAEGFDAELARRTAEASGQTAKAPSRQFDVVLLDVDHTPTHVLHPSHAAFYSVEGLRRLRTHLKPDGVFALWSDDPPDEAFLAVLRETFSKADGHVVTFANPLTSSTSANCVYLAC